MTRAFFKYKLADPGAGVQGQRTMPQIHNFQCLMVGDARLHKAGGDMDSEPEPREPASSFKPAGYRIGKSYFLLRDPQDHLPGFDDEVSAVFDVHGFGYIVKMRILFYMVDLRLFFKDPEIVAERKIDGTGPDLRSVERLYPDQFAF
jgi:hypothetical protein